MSYSAAHSHHMVSELRLLMSSLQDDPMGGIFNPDLPPVFDVYDDEVPSSLGQFCLFNEPGGTSLFHNGFTKEDTLAVNFDLPPIFDGTINCNDATSETKWTAQENRGVNYEPVCLFGSACYYWKAMVNDTFHFHGFDDAPRSARGLKHFGQKMFRGCRVCGWNQQQSSKVFNPGIGQQRMNAKHHLTSTLEGTRIGTILFEERADDTSTDASRADDQALG